MRININCFSMMTAMGKIGAVRLHIVSEGMAVRAYVQPPSLLFKVLYKNTVNYHGDVPYAPGNHHRQKTPDPHLDHGGLAPGAARNWVSAFPICMCGWHRVVPWL
jgi:hypothetical protein